MLVTWSSADPLTMTAQLDENGRLAVNIWQLRSKLWIHGIFSSWETLRSRLFAASLESQSSEEFASKLGIHSSEGVALWLQFTQLMSFGAPDKIAFFPKTSRGLLAWFGETSRSFQAGEAWYGLWRAFVSSVRSCSNPAQRL